MQRTVHGTKFTFVDIKVDDNGTIGTEVKSQIVPETDRKTAERKLTKIIGHTVTIIKAEETTELWILEDEIFFKYAHKATGEELKKAVAENPSEKAE